MPQKYPTPIAIFDTLEYALEQQEPTVKPLPCSVDDFKIAFGFLKQYDGSEATFNTYRREIERLLQWSWLIAKKSIIELKRTDIEDYIKFCTRPPKAWIALKQATRFIDREGSRTPNPRWRPFVIQLNKVEIRQGVKPDKNKYSLSRKAIRDVFKVISSFYSYLLQENTVEVNPVVQIRQKSKYFRKQQTAPNIPRLSNIQWQYVIHAVEEKANNNPETHERTLFIISCFYLMYLRISELVASERWTPQMKHFYENSNGDWWFTTVGKGNKQRHIVVSDDMLKTLQRYREKSGLSSLPSPNDSKPLIPKLKGNGAVSDVTVIRRLVQQCFDAAAESLKKAKLFREAEDLSYATVHWLRHTGISDDINKRGRPVAHVKDDAGHESINTTYHYSDITLQERHDSGKNKKLGIN